MIKVNESIMYLFKAYLVDSKYDSFVPDYDALKEGILIDIKCDQSIINTAIEMWGIDGYILNQTFHKSLSTVVKSSMEELVLKQVMHYVTTYGFEQYNIYNSNDVYIPCELLEVPELSSDIKLINIIPVTIEELKDKLWSLLTSSIALSKKTIECIINLADYLDITVDNIDKITNREAKIALYDKLGIVPKNNIEFLRYLIYKLTNKTLLIKDKETIELLKASNKKEALELINKYNDLYGLVPLSEIFNRFKPLFLSLKTSKYIDYVYRKNVTITKIYKQKNREEIYLNTIINKISKLSKKNHKPLVLNNLDNFYIWYINNIGKKDYLKIFEDSLKKESIWRIIRLRNYISLINNNISERVYKIRNGKVWITSKKQNISIDKKIEDILDEIIVNKLKENVFGKKIYIDKCIDIALPQSEKQFVGNIPFSSKISLDKDNVVVGIHWYNIFSERVDLDLKVISNEYTIGWDADYRNSDKLLFTGDMTDAPRPTGASEYIYVDKSIGNTIFSLKVNNYTRNLDNIEYDIIIGRAFKEKIRENYIVDPNDIIVRIPKNSIDKDKYEQSLGNIIINDNKIELIFSDLTTSNRRSSSNSSNEEILRNYLYYENINKCMLKDYLERAGCNIVSNMEEADIDLSINSLNKNTIIDLFK